MEEGLNRIQELAGLFEEVLLEVASLWRILLSSFGIPQVGGVVAESAAQPGRQRSEWGTYRLTNIILRDFHCSKALITLSMFD